MTSVSGYIVRCVYWESGGPVGWNFFSVSQFWLGDCCSVCQTSAAWIVNCFGVTCPMWHWRLLPSVPWCKYPAGRGEVLCWCVQLSAPLYAGHCGHGLDSSQTRRWCYQSGHSTAEELKVLKMARRPWISIAGGEQSLWGFCECVFCV